ncbi:uncharacterized protein SAMN05443252_101223 [Bacillus sp. OV322]|uniref:DUF418 domain-containing protein n=1 Tax=Bacillus sp. OV322 TaxID=1882764 RepID=UPI0008F1A856|nr:DUF418 domain-containing protein [Bacillus sp. OV322]SFB96597.1 uncharacterized protein SAMN05443252_101223 [Bacillus sp. OV322]
MAKETVLFKARITSVDSLRGIALFGILLVNILSYFYPVAYMDPAVWRKGFPFHFIYIFIDITAQASFYPVFSFLFGFGAAVSAERFLHEGKSFSLFFAKRLIILSIFGIVHAFLIWSGDILIHYSLFGFAFLLFYKWEGKFLLLTGAALYIIPFFLTGVLMAMSADNPVNAGAAMAGKALNMYQTGTFEQITMMRIKEWQEMNNAESFIFLFLSVFPFLLIGAGFAKLRWLHAPDQFKNLLGKLAVISLVAGLILKFLPYATVSNSLTEFIQDQFGGPLLSMFYITGTALALQQYAGSKLSCLLAAAGKMSLSNYILQSIVCTMLSYSYGLGLYGRMTLAECLGVAAIIFSLQLGASFIWIQRYYLGPIEYVWRFASYGKRPFMKKRRL